jgi:hypothetical protein
MEVRPLGANAAGGAEDEAGRGRREIERRDAAVAVRDEEGVVAGQELRVPAGGDALGDRLLRNEEMVAGQAEGEDRGAGGEQARGLDAGVDRRVPRGGERSGGKRTGEARVEAFVSVGPEVTGGGAGRGGNERGQRAGAGRDEFGGGLFGERGHGFGLRGLGGLTGGAVRAERGGERDGVKLAPMHWPRPWLRARPDGRYAIGPAHSSGRWLGSRARCNRCRPCRRTTSRRRRPGAGRG